MIKVVTTTFFRRSKPIKRRFNRTKPNLTSPYCHFHFVKKENCNVKLKRSSLIIFLRNYLFVGELENFLKKEDKKSFILLVLLI
jgi:hypothetical protein